MRSSSGSNAQQPNNNRDFWRGFLDHLRQSVYVELAGKRNDVIYNSMWFVLVTGRDDFKILVKRLTRSNLIGAYFYLKTPDARRFWPNFCADQTSITTALQHPFIGTQDPGSLVWRKDSRIGFEWEIDPNDRIQWPAMYPWLAPRMAILKKVMGSRVQDFPGG